MERENTEGNEGVREKVDWNLSAEIIRQCGLLLDGGMKSMVGSNPTRAYIRFKSIRKLIVFKLSSDERKDMKSKEKILDLCIYYIRHISKEKEIGSNLNEINKGKKYLSKINFNFLVDQYQESLMDLMHKYGFMLGVKEDDTDVGWS